ncbi:hypothetical protein VNO77_26972 [Canavalia gladiata]|uniref:RING-type E3 ubiquitin transferase n=1 Tax=Canavalia gladiata TaxID=3824 RepID=A0AAN9Q621_CANGL
MSYRVCKFYARGACLKGEQCDFYHERKDDICTYYQKGFCAYGSRCRYKHVKASQASSSANGHQSAASVSMVNLSHSTKGTSSWVPKAAKPSTSIKGSQHKHLASLGNDDVAPSYASSAIPTEHLFCTFAAANCPLGDKCLRIHGNQCLYCRKFCLHPTDLKEKERHLRTCEKKEKYLQALKDSEEIECNVCLERVLSKPKPSDCKFGLLPECDHAFCLSCIRNWRNSAPASGLDINNTANNTVRTCPVCRKLSYFVIPSGIWYSTKEEKQEIIDNYKANCKLINCKHFNFGNGNCPFGDSCFYKHTVKPGSYMWIHHRPPPQPRQNVDMYDVIDILSEVDLSSGEYYSIMRDTPFFDDMDPFEMMAMPDRLTGGSGPCVGPFDSDDEYMYIFQMAALSEALVSGVDDFGPEDFDDEEFNPMEAALISMMLHSNMEEGEEEDEYSDEDY